MFFVGLALTSLLGLASAIPAPQSPLVVHESRSAVPDGFVKTNAAPIDATLNLHIGIVQGDPETLQQELYAISTPGNPRYRQHLSAEEATSYLAPKPESAKAVTDWLAANGIKSDQASFAGDWLSISTTVGKANELFDTSFHTYTHAGSGTEAVRVMSYSIPEHLKGHLDFVHPTVGFPSVSAQNFDNKASIVQPAAAPAPISSRDDIPDSCYTMITPDCLQALYGFPSNTTSAAPGQPGRLLVLGFEDEYPQRIDLRSFLAEYRPEVAKNTTFIFEPLDDEAGRDPQSIDYSGDQANLDIQYTLGLAPGIPTTFLEVHQTDPAGAQKVIDWIFANKDKAYAVHTMTTSYIWNEGDLPHPVATNLCNGYASLGTYGISVFFASGHNGVGDQRGDDCLTFAPTFPASCPFVTAVGATAGIPETGASFTNGGFSNYFAQPAYQNASVGAYLATLGRKNAGLFTPVGRAYPDISAQGAEVAYYSGDALLVHNGTSAATPAAAAIMAMLNDELVAEGRKPMGFLNPWLYSTAEAAEALNDITTGNNPGCNTDGFPAAKGWDPITGLGTPNYAKLRAAAGI